MLNFHGDMKASIHIDTPQLLMLSFPQLILSFMITMFEYVLKGAVQEHDQNGHNMPSLFLKERGP